MRIHSYIVLLLNGASIFLSCGVAGGYLDFGDNVSGSSKDILEYRDGSWRKVGEMKKRRSGHGQTTSIKYEDFSNYCNLKKR